MRYFFEDLCVDQRFQTEPIKVEQDNILTFARQYDPQVFHTDPEAAKETVFGGLLAPGLYTLCLTFGQWFRLENWQSLGSPGLDQLRWLQPVWPGDHLYGVATIVSLRESNSKPDRGIVAFQLAAHNQNDAIVMTVECIDFVKRRPAEALFQ